MSDAKFWVLLLLGIVLLPAISLWVIRQAELPGAIAKIEQLRVDAADVDPTQAEDVIGQVTQWNQRIVEMQTLNRQWWAGWVIPDEWATVAPIPVPVSQ